MTLRLNGSTSGYTEIDAPAVAGSNTLVLPTGNGTADQVLATNGSGAMSWADRGRMTLATAQNTTSGTSIDFTGIPSWVKRITMMLNGVSTNGASVVQIQLGTSAGVATTGYASHAGIAGIGNSASGLASTSGFSIGTTSAAIDVRYGHTVLTLVSGSFWIASHSYGLTATSGSYFIGGAGAMNLSGTLDRLRLTTVNGTDTFDAGSVNILYEG
jgi:hypothetical protein